MLFFKILQQLLLPSSFVLLLIVVGLFLWVVSRRKTLGKVLMLFGILLYYLFSITIVSNYLLSPLEDKYSPLEEEDVERADEVVLLLGGKEADILRGSEVLRISYLRNQEVKIIISGTDPLLPTSEEALGVKKFFVSRGLEEENIVIEGRSRNTWENIRNVREIVGEEPFFLVTSAYHMERAKREFEKVEASFIPAPTDFKVKTEKYNALDFFPDAQNLRNSDLAVHEYLGILWYNFVY
jgi:uncharacterized SAM-binding protein YcdF (DUF218 family)